MVGRAADRASCAILRGRFFGPPQTFECVEGIGLQESLYPLLKRCQVPAIAQKYPGRSAGADSDWAVFTFCAPDSQRWSVPVRAIDDALYALRLRAWKVDDDHGLRVEVECRKDAAIFHRNAVRVAQQASVGAARYHPLLETMHVVHRDFLEEWLNQEWSCNRWPDNGHVWGADCSGSRYTSHENPSGTESRER
jgi:hypothetical protein